MEGLSFSTCATTLQGNAKGQNLCCDITVHILHLPPFQGPWTNVRSHLTKRNRTTQLSAAPKAKIYDPNTFWKSWDQASQLAEVIVMAITKITYYCSVWFWTPHFKNGDKLEWVQKKGGVIRGQNFREPWRWPCRRHWEAIRTSTGAEACIKPR